MAEFEIRGEELDKFAYHNAETCARPFRAVVLEFHGLGFSGLVQEPPALAGECAKRGALYLFPYYGPWSWMNDTAVRYTDEVIKAAKEYYRLPPDIPMISTGGSMGGLSALIYTRYAAVTPVACAANCPVCDLPYHFTERPDLPRTMFCAFGHYDCDFTQALETASPLHQVERMPDIPYYIVHGDADQSVGKRMHSDRFVGKMRRAHRVTYDEVPGMKHCALKDEALMRYYDFIFRFLK